MAVFADCEDSDRSGVHIKRAHRLGPHAKWDRPETSRPPSSPPTPVRPAQAARYLPQIGVLKSAKNP